MFNLNESMGSGLDQLTTSGYAIGLTTGPSATGYAQSFQTYSFNYSQFNPLVHRLFLDHDSIFYF